MEKYKQMENNKHMGKKRFFLIQMINKIAVYHNQCLLAMIRYRKQKAKMVKNLRRMKRRVDQNKKGEKISVKKLKRLNKTFQ